jgi:hypothetical protein
MGSWIGITLEEVGGRRKNAKCQNPNFKLSSNDK